MYVGVCTSNMHVCALVHVWVNVCLMISLTSNYIQRCGKPEPLLLHEKARMEGGRLGEGRREDGEKVEEAVMLYADCYPEVILKLS